MLKLRILQAEYGDCMILEFGSSSSPRYILIDGGPETIYEKHLRKELQKIREGGGKLDLTILSHVDNDHIIGLLDLMAELRNQKDNGNPGTVSIDELWHNSFGQTIGSGNDIQTRLETLLASAGAARHVMATTGMAVTGVGEGNTLRRDASLLGIPINPRFPKDLITVDEQPGKLVFNNLTLRIVGPTKKNLEELKKKWIEWLDKYEVGIATVDPFVAAMADRSIPNLSSIMFLAEAEGKRILFTGDGRGDHLLQGLGQANLLNANGGIHVDVLKVPHHGSDRNVTKKFFKTVTADKYVISANGKDDNPDLATLIWIVEAAKDQNRTIEIFVTNKTESTEKLVAEYDPDDYGYRLSEGKEGCNSTTFAVAP